MRTFNPLYLNSNAFYATLNPSIQVKYPSGPTWPADYAGMQDLGEGINPATQAFGALSTTQQQGVQLALEAWSRYVQIDFTSSAVPDGKKISFGLTTMRPGGVGYYPGEVGASLPMERVHFLGALPYRDYLRVLQVSSCHVYLTYPFVLSWSCLEAMSAGCVVVASGTAPVREVIEHGRTGLLFDFFDVEGFAHQVVDVLARPEAHIPLGQAARQLVVERYDLGTKCLPRQLALITQ